MARQSPARTGEPAGARWASAATSPPSRPVVRERGGEGVVVEQRRGAGHGRDPVRGVGDRVEHGERRRVDARPGRCRARQAEHRKQHPGGGEASPSAACGGAVDVDQQLVHARRRPARGRIRAAGRTGCTGTCAPGASTSASGSKAGTAESVGASPSSASRTWPSVVSGLPRWTRTCRSVTGIGPVVDEGARDGERGRPVGGDDARGHVGEHEPQPAGGGGRGRGPGAEEHGEGHHDDRGHGRDRPHAVSSSSSVARRISRRSSA